MGGFELFDSHTVSKIVDKITITKHFQINFPSAFCKINGLENKKSVLLYSDKVARRIAIVFCDEIDSRGFKLSVTNGGKYGMYATSKSFFALNGFATEENVGRHEYTRIVLDGQTAFVLQLK